MRTVHSRKMAATVGPYHHVALEVHVMLPYSNGLSRDRALEAAGKIAVIHEDYNRRESNSFELNHRDMYPVNTRIASMNLKIASGEAFTALHKEKEVSTFVF